MWNLFDWLWRSDNRIGKETVARGHVDGKGSFRIDGRLEGNLETDSWVIIGEKGAVIGDVRASKITVRGQVTGHVHTTGALYVGPKGRVLGDAEMASFRVAPGGIFRGRSAVGARDVPQAFAAPDDIRGRTLPPPDGRPVPPPVLRPALAEQVGHIPPVAASEERIRADLEASDSAEQSALRAIGGG